MAYIPQDMRREMRRNAHTGGGGRQNAASCSRHKNIETLLIKYAHAVKRYASLKTRVLLERRFKRVKKGQTLSHLFPDYRKYRLMLRLKRDRDVAARNLRVQKDFYIWKEGDRIIMASDIMWMALAEQKRQVEDIIAKAPKRWTLDAYRREAEKTLKTAKVTSFRLDCQHTAELEGLVEKAIRDLKANDGEQALSPQKFGAMLTVLRAYITYNYYKSLSQYEFEQRFRQLAHRLGRGKWSHQKLYRLLGLNVIGQIESDSAFRRKYNKAISRAVRRYPRVPRKWIEQIIWIESRGDPKTISRAGAYGLMQLMPLVYMGMGREKARQYPLAFEQTINPFHPETNIERGAAFLDKLRRVMWPKIRRYGAARRKKIIFHAYNAGISRVLGLLKKHGPHYEGYLPGETKLYLDRLADFPRR